MCGLSIYFLVVSFFNIFVCFIFGERDLEFVCFQCRVAAYYGCCVCRDGSCCVGG